MQKLTKTSVEWFSEQLAKIGVTRELIGHLISEAKEMEKEQIMHAYGQGAADEAGEILDATKDAEQYYKERFKSK
jgi:hypothetical protein